MVSLLLRCCAGRRLLGIGLPSTFGRYQQPTPPKKNKPCSQTMFTIHVHKPCSQTMFPHCAPEGESHRLGVPLLRGPLNSASKRKRDRLRLARARGQPRPHSHNTPHPPKCPKSPGHRVFLPLPSPLHPPSPPACARVRACTPQAKLHPLPPSPPLAFPPNPTHTTTQLHTP